MVLRKAIGKGVLEVPVRLFFFDLGLSIYFFLFNLFLMDHGYSEKP